MNPRPIIYAALVAGICLANGLCNGQEIPQGVQQSPPAASQQAPDVAQPYMLQRPAWGWRIRAALQPTPYRVVPMQQVMVPAWVPQPMPDSVPNAPWLYRPRCLNCW